MSSAKVLASIGEQQESQQLSSRVSTWLTYSTPPNPSSSTARDRRMSYSKAPINCRTGRTARVICFLGPGIRREA